MLIIKKIEMISDALTNAEKRVTWKDACTLSQEYTDDAVVWLAQNDTVVHLCKILTFVKQHSILNAQTDGLSVHQSPWKTN